MLKSKFYVLSVSMAITALKQTTKCVIHVIR